MSEFIPYFSAILYKKLSLVQLIKVEINAVAVLSYRKISGYIFHRSFLLWEIVVYGVYFVYSTIVNGIFGFDLLFMGYGYVMQPFIYYQAYRWLKQDESNNIRHHIRLKFCLAFSAAAYILKIIEQFFLHTPAAPRLLSIELLSLGYILLAIWLLKDLWIQSVNRPAEHSSIETDFLGLISDQYSLTVREKEILDLLLKGYDNEEICSRAFIAMGTVKVHTHNIYQKLGIKRRGQLNGFIRAYTKQETL
jgi:DNA-binding CsgD family transcriptional regulator